jgi:hypothetical protein
VIASGQEEVRCRVRVAGNLGSGSNPTRKSLLGHGYRLLVLPGAAHRQILVIIPVSQKVLLPKPVNRNSQFLVQFLVHLLLDRSHNIGPLIPRWELDEFKISCNKIFRTSKILTLLYQQFSNLLISQREMSGPRFVALSNNR